MFAECLHGFPAALAPDGNLKQQHLLSGNYLFTNITFQCHGRVTAFKFSGYFDPGVRYSRLLSMQIMFYTLSGFQYKLEKSYTMHLNLGSDTISQKQPSLLTDANGLYYVSVPLVTSMTSKVDIPVPVSPGYILGISLPQTVSFPGTVVSHGVNIVVVDDMRRQALKLNESYWSIYTSSRMSETWMPIHGIVPVIQVEFTESGGIIA